MVASSTTLLRKVQAVIDSASMGRRDIMSAFDIWPITEPSTATTIAIWSDIQNGPSSERT